MLAWPEHDDSSERKGCLMSAQATFETTLHPAHPRANRRFKDSMFRDLFGSPERKENALELYNALNGTKYDDPDLLELTTLDDVIYLNVKNDVSFLIGEELVLWEHQSTPNPNMPIRGLIYFGRLYASFIEKTQARIYDRTQVHLPTPRYVVLYAGSEVRPEREVLRLTDAFERENASIELTCEVINVNTGYNTDVAVASPSLAGYAEFVGKVRRKCGTMELEGALHEAITECIDEGVLGTYLSEKTAEVFDMFMTEFDEELIHRQAREAGFEEGLAEGRAEGLQRGLEQGLEQGLEKGLEQGWNEGREQTVVELASKGLIDAAVAAEYLGITAEELTLKLDK